MEGGKKHATPAEGDRLQKVLAAAGVASRRAAEEMIAVGRVTVNGVTAVVGQRAVLGRDVVTVDGQELTAPQPRAYVALNKPSGFVTSLSGTHGEQTIMELLEASDRVFPVGRLDKDTSGLLLLTNDGDWANLVTHPRYGIQKEYEVTVQGQLAESTLLSLRRGVSLLDGTKTSPAAVRPLAESSDQCQLLVTLVEGKKRQIRLMFAAVGHPVTGLRRVRIGTVRLGSLSEGQTRALTPVEVDGIRQLAERGTDERQAKADDRHRRPGSRG
jgi:23S rRNA pseudouridine2605 synthase